MTLALHGSRKVKWDSTGALYSIIASRTAIHTTGLRLPHLSVVIRVDTRMSKKALADHGTNSLDFQCCQLVMEYIAPICLDRE